MAKKRLHNINIIREPSQSKHVEGGSSSDPNVFQIPEGNEAVETREYSDLNAVDDNGNPKKTRGRTTLKEIWSLPPEDRIVVSGNKYGQPIGQESQLLAGFLGMLARNGRKCPIHHDSWHRFSKNDKLQLMRFIKQRFVLDFNEKYVFKSLSKKWRHYKAALKEANHDPDLDRLVARKKIPRGVVARQYELLVDFWYSEEGMKRERLGKASRKCQKHTHTNGSRSFARTGHERGIEKGEEIGRLELFQITHTRKDGTFLNEETQRIMEKAKEKMAEYLSSTQDVESRNIQDIENQVILEVVGPEKNGRVRYTGLGPTPSSYFGSSSHRYTSSQRASKEVDKLRDEMKIELAKIQAEREEEKRRYREMQAEREEEKKRYQELQSQNQNLQSQLQSILNIMQQQSRPPPS